jgi:hypothetical protein
MASMFRMHQLVHRLAGMKLYGSEMRSDGDDAQDTLNNLISEARRITGVAGPAEPPICDHCFEPISGEPHRTDNPYNSSDVTILCEPCAERANDRQQEKLASEGCGPTLLEQQQAARRFK